MKDPIPAGYHQQARVHYPFNADLLANKPSPSIVASFAHSLVFIEPTTRSTGWTTENEEPMDSRIEEVAAPVPASHSILSHGLAPDLIPRKSVGFTHRAFVSRVVIYSGLLAASTATAISLMVRLAA
ncbi:MAG: hypothetical protein JWQ43_1966 [Glaciihabitans sp.]|nr:hypothetical protein [Glaciihabitans sp.]